MINLKEWQKEVFKIYEKIRSHKKPYKIETDGVILTVLPNVFSPKYFTDSLWFAKELSKIVKNKTLLEIGTGTGIIAIFCAFRGTKVVATDINPEAVKNAKLNSEIHKLNVDVRKGNLYEPIKENEKFDFIFWNHPFHNWKFEVKDVLLKAGFDTKYKALEGYVKGAGKHLTSNGRLLLGTGNIADLNEIERIAEENGYKLVLRKKGGFPLTEGGEMKSEYLIYEFRK